MPVAERGAKPIIEDVAMPAKLASALHLYPSAPDRARYAALNRPLPWTHPQRYYYAALRLAMKTVGQLSNGIRIGWRHGFDSGPMLEYVYENRPRGWLALGRWLDRVYLDAVGWRGIRERGRLLEEALTQRITALRAQNRPVRVLDVAAGPGRYVLNVLARLNDPQVSALCRDRDAQALSDGQRRAGMLGVRTIRFEEGDAFDARGLSLLRPRPQLAIVSGLYELFEDNTQVAQSLAGLYQALAVGGYLLYTNQPRHPQLELIARTLSNRYGQPWVMRPRPQAEMDALVRQAGFTPLSTKTDAAGIFTVTVAVKESSC